MCDRRHRGQGRPPDNVLTAPVPCLDRLWSGSLDLLPALSTLPHNISASKARTTSRQPIAVRWRPIYLRSLGYRIVAKNFRTPHEHGEIDMIGWDDGVLCFVEVKTLTKVILAPPEMAVDAEKRRHIRSVARRYVRRLRSDRPPPCRFDVVSVVLGDEHRGPMIRLHKGAFAWKVARMPEHEFQAGTSRGRWWRQ